MQPDDVAVYFATVKTLALVHFVYFAVKAGVAQRYAAFTHGDPEGLAAFARETVSWTFWPSLLMAIIVLALGKPMLVLFGPEFVQPAIRCCSCWCSASSRAPPSARPRAC